MFGFRSYGKTPILLQRLRAYETYERIANRRQQLRTYRVVGPADAGEIIMMPSVADEVNQGGDPQRTEVTGFQGNSWIETKERVRAIAIILDSEGFCKHLTGRAGGRMSRRDAGTYNSRVAKWIDWTSNSSIDSNQFLPLTNAEKIFQWIEEITVNKFASTGEFIDSFGESTEISASTLDGYLNAVNKLIEWYFTYKQRQYGRRHVPFSELQPFHTHIRRLKSELRKARRAEGSKRSDMDSLIKDRKQPAGKQNVCCDIYICLLLYLSVPI